MLNLSQDCSMQILAVQHTISRWQGERFSLFASVPYDYAWKIIGGGNFDQNLTLSQMVSAIQSFIA